MSAQTFHDAMQPAIEAQKAAVYRATWGHLAPRRNKRYKGTMLFAHGDYGDLVPLQCDLAGLDDSPWFYDCMTDFIEENAPEPGVYRFVGYFCNYRFVGTVERIEI